MEKKQIQLSDEINEIIYFSHLTSEKNIFFVSAGKKEFFSIDSAYIIALKWREITKNFLFTTIKGIGVMAEKINEQKNPDLKIITTLQTAVSIIADDLYSANVVFGQSNNNFDANKAHYKWWETSILNPIESLVCQEKIVEKIKPDNTEELIKKMKQFSDIPIGAAIQLRIVENIASDICIAFKNIFSQVEHNGNKVYKSDKELSWILSHIKAELIHQKKVETDFCEALYEIDPNISKDMILNLTRDYCHYWNKALSDFAYYLDY
jgi:hypothetical protein